MTVRYCPNTDDALPWNVIVEVRRCATKWEPNARIIGDVRAGDIVRAIDGMNRVLAIMMITASRPDGPDPTEAEIDAQMAKALAVNDGTFTEPSL